MSFMWFFAGIFIGIALLWLLQRFGWKKKATDGSPDFSVIEQRLSGIESKLKALLEIRGDMKESQGADRVVSPVIKPEESPVREQKQGKPAPPVSLEKEPVRDEKPGKLKEKKVSPPIVQIEKTVPGKMEVPAISIAPPRVKGTEKRTPSPEILSDPLVRTLARDASKSKTVPGTTTPRVSLATETTELKKRKGMVSSPGSSLADSTGKSSAEPTKKTIDPNQVDVKGIFGSSVNRGKKTKQ